MHRNSYYEERKVAEWQARLDAKQIPLDNVRGDHIRSGAVLSTEQSCGPQRSSAVASVK